MTMSTKQCIAEIRKSCKLVWARQHRNSDEHPAYLIDDEPPNELYVSIMWDSNGKRARIPKDLVRDELGSRRKMRPTSQLNDNFMDKKAKTSRQMSTEKKSKITQMVAAEPSPVISAAFNPSVFDEDTDEEANIKELCVPSPVVSAVIKTEPGGHYDQDTDDEECLSNRSAEISADSITKTSIEHTKELSDSVALPQIMGVCGSIRPRQSRNVPRLQPRKSLPHHESGKSFRCNVASFPRKMTPNDSNRKMTPIDSSKLAPLQKPPPLPELPSSKDCIWTFDDASRVLLADFRTPATNSGKVVVTCEDEEYLMKMMERDDITVISEGLADDFDLSLLGQTYIESRLGTQFHHRVKEFRKTSSRTPPCGLQTGEAIGQWDENGFHSMKFKDYFSYLSLKQQLLNSDYLCANDKMFTYKDSNGKVISIDVTQSVLYLLDLNMKLLPLAYEKFIHNFKLVNILPGGAHCMMNAVNLNGRPFMGPSIYMTPPSSFTELQQDGHGTVDSGHYCCRGYNEIIMLRRLPERHKHNALNLLHSSSSPHDVNTLLRWPTNKAIEKCNEMG